MAELLTFDEWMSVLEEKVDRVPRSQAVIFNFQVIPRLGKLLSDKASSCSECRMYWQKLQESTQHIDQFFDDGNSYSKDFEKVADLCMQHLKQTHSIRPKGYVLSKYVASGMGIGVLLGAFVALLVPSLELKGLVLSGWVLGMMLGYYGGVRKERKMKKEDLLF